jgi:hypothetical protein
MASLPLEYLEGTINLVDSDWEIVYIPIVKIKPDNLLFSGTFLEKVVNYIKLLYKDYVFPPIIVNSKNKIIDGQCRYYAYKMANKKKIPCLREIKNGSGKLVRNEVYKGGKFVKAREWYLLWRDNVYD